VPDIYAPAGWFARTFSLAPTVRVDVPAVRVPVPDGVLVKLSTVILFPPEEIITDAGRVITYVKPASPVTVKEAAVTVPVVAGRVTPPNVERAPAGVNVTDPGFTLEATFPKFISDPHAIAIGVIIVAEARAVCDTWANISVENASIAKSTTKSFFIILILVRQILCYKFKDIELLIYFNF